MPYVAQPRGGADRIYDDPVEYNPYMIDKDLNKYKEVTDVVSYALLFFAVYKLFNRITGKN